MKKQLLTKENKQYLVSLSLSIIAALLIGALIMLANGRSPLVGYKALIVGSFGSTYKIANTLAKTLPLLLTGLATAISFKAGISNIGGEGQLYLGAFAAAYVGITFTSLPGPIGVVLAILLSMLVGAVYAYFPAVLKVRLGVDEVITTIMLNTVAKEFTKYLVNNPFAASDAKMAGTDIIATQYQFKKMVKLSTLNSSIFISIGISLVIYFLMQKTSDGYEFNMVGQNKLFARYSGIDDKKRMIIAMLISGGLCGITGAFEVMGVHYRFLDNISPDMFFDGMLVSLVVRNNPIGIFFMSIFFGAMKTGSVSMENATGIPSELVAVIQAIIILFIAGETGFKNIYNNWKIKRQERAKEVQKSV